MEPVFRALEIAAKSLVKAQGLQLDFVGPDKLLAHGGWCRRCRPVGEKAKWIKCRPRSS